jgi:2',3'-cyclic-nucleotide 2'-phosphodiesterase (5'-nucleotidase family)
VLGGLAQRAAFVAQVRKSRNPVIVVDSGDVFFSSLTIMEPPQAVAKARLIGRSYIEMGVTALNVGSGDLGHGLDFLLEQGQAGLPLISANLRDRVTKMPVFPPYTIAAHSGIQVAFVGLTSQSEASVKMNEVGNRFMVTDPVEATREILQELKGKCDVLILLSDLPLYRIQEVVKAGSGINFVLGAQERALSTKPLKKESAYFLQSAAKGIYMGRLDLEVSRPGYPFEDAGKIIEMEEELIRLDQHLEELQTQLGVPSKEETEFRIGLVKKRKAGVEEDMRRASATGGSRTNHFDWKLVPIDPEGPEDPRIREWIRAARIDEEMLWLFPMRCEP